MPVHHNIVLSMRSQVDHLTTSHLAEVFITVLLFFLEAAERRVSVAEFRLVHTLALTNCIRPVCTTLYDDGGDEGNTE